MEVVLGWLVIGGIIWLIRSAWRSGDSLPPRSPGARPSAAPYAGGPTAPSSSPVRREGVWRDETPDDAFAIGFIIGREFGHDDAEPKVPAVDDVRYDAASYADDDVGDWGSGDGGDAGEF